MDKVAGSQDDRHLHQVKKRKRSIVIPGTSKFRVVLRQKETNSDHTRLIGDRLYQGNKDNSCMVQNTLSYGGSTVRNTFQEEEHCGASKQKEGTTPFYNSYERIDQSENQPTFRKNPKIEIPKTCATIESTVKVASKSVYNTGNVVHPYKRKHFEDTGAYYPVNCSELAMQDAFGNFAQVDSEIESKKKLKANTKSYIPGTSKFRINLTGLNSNKTKHTVMDNKGKSDFEPGDIWRGGVTSLQSVKTCSMCLKRNSHAGGCCEHEYENVFFCEIEYKGKRLGRYDSNTGFGTDKYVQFVSSVLEHIEFGCPDLMSPKS
ncbi:hypothetical protein AX774_g3663 [Zancudomyces culisetae]|uniref:Uncharacterized protein n=1 Tax=Zancudomyces culisetae TaxID=1213189 RepID=A0A1R1PPE9_ZANCU|nr:hypothetical protein AX774_g3663 [Zancudomyces culisetae]|eukprot:OMH82838.1 hypothetical protein AX774_g3663 [Zancudomyces culisetae]